jgi:hypothetical protein
MNLDRTNPKSLSVVLDAEWRAATASAPAPDPTLAARVARRRRRSLGFAIAGGVGAVALAAAVAVPAFAALRHDGGDMPPASTATPSAAPYPGYGSTSLIVRYVSAADTAGTSLLDGILFVQASDSGTWASVTSIPTLTATGPMTCTLNDGTQVVTSATTYRGLFAEISDRGDIFSESDADRCLTMALSADLGIDFDGGIGSDMEGYTTRLDEASPIRLCLAAPAYSERSNLDLPAGAVTVDGLTALAYARSRSIAGADESQAAQSERDAYVLAEALWSLTARVQAAAGADPGPWLSGVHSSQWGKPTSIAEMASYYGPEWTRIYFGVLPVSLDGDTYRFNDATKAWADAVRSSSPPPGAVTLASVDAGC